MSGSEDELFKKKKPSKKKLEQQQQKQQQQQQQQIKQQIAQDVQGDAKDPKDPKKPKLVVYCKLCTLPVEFCSYSKNPNDCRDWLKSTFESLYIKLYPDHVKQEQEKAQIQQQQQLQQQQQQQISDCLNQQMNAPLPEKKKKKKVKVTESEMIYIKVKERNRNKFITTLSGLEKHGIDIKEAQKKISKRFGCGSSINEKGAIELQGDLSLDLEEWLPKEYNSIKEDMIAIQEK